MASEFWEVGTENNVGSPLWSMLDCLNHLLSVFTRTPQIFSEGSFLEVKYW